ncbi:MAG: hypothetical protein NTZ83_05020 [Candidatus Pacearchaeota archaeon]|nr:hypothetical protein [Candidatus Pacearchaeota archaeon]
MKKVELGFINYKLLRNNSAITRDNPEEINNLIRAFPGEYIEGEDVGRSYRTIVGVNGNASYIYSGNENTDINIPKKYEKDIKEKLESAGYKLEGRKCQ